jgi:hypothetical protein
MVVGEDPHHIWMIECGADFLLAFESVKANSVLLSDFAARSSISLTGSSG